MPPRLRRWLLAGLAAMLAMSALGGFVAVAVLGSNAAGVVLAWVVFVTGLLIIGLGARRAVRAASDSFDQMANQLHAGDEQRRQLLADVGHELRTPLAVIRGEMEAMVDGVRPIDPHTVEALLDDIAGMERLLDDLRTLATAESEQLVLQLEEVDVRELARDVVDDLSRQARAAAVELVLADGRSVSAEIDPVRVRGILVNLVVNAIRATPPDGRVTISVSTDLRSPRPFSTQLVVQVTDTGVGIPAGDLDRVFDRFHKGEGSRGSGLGLTIARRYARAHDGDLTVDSLPGEGATFTLTIPGV